MGNNVFRSSRPPEGSVNIRARRFKGTARREEGTYWGVFIGNAMQGKWVAKRSTAESFAKAINTAQRPCMCCRRLFLSEGAHNRLCYTCRRRASEEWL